MLNTSLPPATIGLGSQPQEEILVDIYARKSTVLI